jgi:hypothetical protein
VAILISAWFGAGQHNQDHVQAGTLPCAQLSPPSVRSPSEFAKLAMLGKLEFGRKTAKNTGKTSNIAKFAKFAKFSRRRKYGQSVSNGVLEMSKMRYPSKMANPLCGAVSAHS